MLNMSNRAVVLTMPDGEGGLPTYYLAYFVKAIDTVPVYRTFDPIRAGDGKFEELLAAAENILDTSLYDECLEERKRLRAAIAAFSTDPFIVLGLAALPTEDRNEL